MNSSDNIYLVGMPGAGKTTVGRQLARRLHRQFIDADHEIEVRAGVKIPVIFETEGEAGFREQETRVIADLAKQSNLIVATGGGAVLRPENCDAIKKSGLVVYLRVAPRILFDRTHHDANRPLLQVANPMMRIEELFTQRDPIYQDVADLVMTSGGGSVFHLVTQVERELRKRCAA
ncbi:shikimate kinase [Rugosibacter aromaticivorans]|uniref:Shikimate kinase n=1 Tax=Rugosibacter aromaticivorans TaxID=1565605 RepID=A0A0C5JB86_9PROT|nr:shikimate kinase [Rugosibacter aromaticivorans]AJP49068.1 shikimate kinase [Rugosibacter aromaticivorans]